MAVALPNPSFIGSVVVVTYILVICVNELGIVRCAEAPAHPPAESSVSSASISTPIQTPASATVPPPAPPAPPAPRTPPTPARAPSQSGYRHTCGPWPEKYQEYEREAMLSLKRAWNLDWDESVHPCNSTFGYPGVTCRATLVDHNDTNGNFVCEILLYRLDLGGGDNIIGELVPEVGDLRNLEFLYIGSSPGLTGPVPASIWSLPNLKEIYLSRNNLSGRVVSNTSWPSILETIDLSHNSLTSWEVNTPLLNLRYLNLEYNSLSGSFNLVKGNTTILSSFYNDLEELDLSHNYLNDMTESIDPLDNGLPSIQTLDMSSNLFSNLSKNLTSFIKKRAYGWSSSMLDLSSNGIGGHLPEWNSMHNVLLRGYSTYKQSMLSELYLDNNSIIGEFNISAFVGSDISKSLIVLSLKFNSITNIIYADEFAGVRTKFLLQGNPYCYKTWPSEVYALRCSIYCERNCTSESPKKESDKTWKVIVVATTSSSALLLLSVILCFAIVLRRNKKYIRALQKKIRKADINAKRFEYSELRAATKNFAPAMKLGSGANGVVYKGILPNNNIVAVKQLFLETDEGRDNFLNEVLLISNLQHRNLVNLKGYCLRGKQTLLVYEYVDNYDLDKLLFSSHHSGDSTLVSNEVLNWQARMKVCQGVAQGLYYLHASSQSKIIHRDIKASNIMLDKNLHPKIADFGLARPIEDARSVIVTQQCAGTLGYLAPEYMCHGELSEKADVYSFGILLLEIVSGKRNRDFTMPEDEVYLPSRAWKLHKEDRLLDMKDVALAVSEDEVVQVQLVLETAVLCVQSAPEKRPSMFQVAAKLAGDTDVHVPPIEDEYNSWAQSIVMDESDNCENPLIISCTSGVLSTTGPQISGHASIGLTMSHTSR